MISKMVPDQKPRLLVLLPEEWAGDLDLARRVARLASCEEADVIYLVAISGHPSKASIIREMVTMIALTSGSGTTVNYELVGKTNWVRTIKSLYRPQDTIVAPKELNSLPGANDYATLRNTDRFFIQEFSHSSSRSMPASSKWHLFDL